jgi:hypothetical protein
VLVAETDVRGTMVSVGIDVTACTQEAKNMLTSKVVTAIFIFISPKFCMNRPTACVTRRWAERDDADLTENLRAQNQLLLTGLIPPVGCTRC